MSALGCGNGLSLITRMIVSSEGIAGKVWRNPWRNSTVSGRATRFFPSDTILAALGDVSSNPSLHAVLVLVYNQHTTQASGQQFAESAVEYIEQTGRRTPGEPTRELTRVCPRARSTDSGGLLLIRAGICEQPFTELSVLDNNCRSS